MICGGPNERVEGETELLDGVVEEGGMNKKTMDDAMRNEIVEYLLKGIRKSLISYVDLNGKEFPREEKGVLHKIFMLLFGSCFKEDESADNLMRSVCSDLEAGNADMFKHVTLINKKAIVREAKKKVDLT
jgi:hypothetical protein